MQTGKHLNKKTTQTIKKLGLLEEGETIFYFYSNYQPDKAGSFITNKRIGHYWIDQVKEKSDTSFAWYGDIMAIDTVYEVGDFDCPYMQIHKKDSTVFRAYINGKREEKRLFFNKALECWKAAAGR